MIIIIKTYLNAFFLSIPLSSMALKKSLQLLVFLLLILCISLSLLFLLHQNNNTNYSNSDTNDSKNYYGYNNLRVIGRHRKMLQSNTQLFDFTPFKRHHRKHVPVRSEPVIDPIYGTEKRLVPTGPNPLHH